MKLDGKVGIVTGGAQNIGKSIVHRLASEGETIIIADLKNSQGEKVAHEMCQLGHKVYFYPTDVTNSENVEKLMEHCANTYGKIDTLVTSAGVLTPPISFEENSEELFDKVIAVNLKGTFLCMKAVAPYMKKIKCGSIITISSRAGMRVGIKNAPYGCSKAGVIMLTQCAAKEFAEFGIRVNSLAPGLTEADSVTDEVRTHLAKTLLMGDLVNPKEHGALVAFLASDEAKHLTGVTITIDGGQNL